MPFIPNTYAEWRQCIEHQCRQPLAREFCTQRLAALRDPNDLHTREFTRLYGRPQLDLTIGWFERAGREAHS